MSEQKLKIRIVIKPPHDVPAAPKPSEPDYKNRRIAAAIVLGLAAVTVIAWLGWQYLTPGASDDLVANKDESPTVAEVETQAAMDVSSSSKPAIRETPEPTLAKREQATATETPAVATASIDSQAAVDVTDSNELTSQEMPPPTLAEREQATPAETPAAGAASIQYQPAVDAAASTELTSQEMPPPTLAEREQATPAKTPAAETTPIESQPFADVTASNEPAIQETPEQNLEELQQSRPAEAPASAQNTELAATALAPIAAAADQPQAAPPNATGTESPVALESEQPNRPDIEPTPSGLESESATRMNPQPAQAVEPAGSVADIASSTTPAGAAETPIASADDTDSADLEADANPTAAAAGRSAGDDLSVAPGSSLPEPSADPGAAPAVPVTSASPVAGAPDQSTPPTQSDSETMPTPTALADPDPGVDAGSPARVARSALSSDVLDREPVDELSGTIMLESGGARRLYYFTEVQDMAGETVQHRWVRNGETVATVNFPIGGVRWRIYSSKLLSSTMDGEWQALAESANGEVLDRIEFNAARP